MTDFLRSPRTAGVLLLSGTFAALILASSPLSAAFMRWVGFRPFAFSHLSLGGWCTEGLMSLFFLTMSIELKQSFKTGALSSLPGALLPLAGAAGGMAVPALIAFVTGSLAASPPLVSGWAVPTATDAAFALPILSLAPVLPSGLRTFIIALAVFDDLGATLELGLFYGQGFRFAALLPSLLLLILMFTLPLPARKSPKILDVCQIFLSLLLWFGLYESGIAPELTGVALGLALPPALGRRLGHRLTVPVNLVVLPLFALCSAGIDLRCLNGEFLRSAPLLGATLGLCIGKPAGIWTAVKLWRFCGLGIPWLHTKRAAMQFLGGSVCCGVGFTMSLLICALAYPVPMEQMQGRAGILIGSSLAAAAGLLLFYLAPRVFPNVPKKSAASA